MRALSLRSKDGRNEKKKKNERRCSRKLISWKLSFKVKFRIVRVQLFYCVYFFLGGREVWRVNRLSRNRAGLREFWSYSHLKGIARGEELVCFRETVQVNSVPVKSGHLYGWSFTCVLRRTCFSGSNSSRIMGILEPPFRNNGQLTFSARPWKITYSTNFLFKLKLDLNIEKRKHENNFTKPA